MGAVVQNITWGTKLAKAALTPTFFYTTHNNRIDIHTYFCVQHFTLLVSHQNKLYFLKNLNCWPATVTYPKTCASCTTLFREITGKKNINPWTKPVHHCSINRMSPKGSSMQLYRTIFTMSTRNESHWFQQGLIPGKYVWITTMHQVWCMLKTAALEWHEAYARKETLWAKADKSSTNAGFTAGVGTF